MRRARAAIAEITNFGADTMKSLPADTFLEVAEKLRGINGKGDSYQFIMIKGATPEAGECGWAE